MLNKLIFNVKFERNIIYQREKNYLENHYMHTLSIKKEYSLHNLYFDP